MQIQNGNGGPNFSITMLHGALCVFANVALISQKAPYQGFDRRTVYCYKMFAKHKATFTDL